MWKGWSYFLIRIFYFYNDFERDPVILVSLSEGRETREEEPSLYVS